MIRLRLVTANDLAFLWAVRNDSEMRLWTAGIVRGTFQ